MAGALLTLSRSSSSFALGANKTGKVESMTSHVKRAHEGRRHWVGADIRDGALAGLHGRPFAGLELGAAHHEGLEALGAADVPWNVELALPFEANFMIQAGDRSMCGCWRQMTSQMTT